MTNIIEDKIVTIDGTEYCISPFPAFKGLTLLKKITKMVGPSITKLMSSSNGESIDLANAEGAVKLLVDNFEGDGVETIIKELMVSVTKGGQPLNFNIEFMANYGKLMKLVAEVIKANYGSVFPTGGFLGQ